MEQCLICKGKVRKAVLENTKTNKRENGFKCDNCNQYYIQ